MDSPPKPTKKLNKEEISLEQEVTTPQRELWSTSQPQR